MPEAYGPGTGKFAAQQALTYPKSPTYKPVIEQAVRNIMGQGADEDAYKAGIEQAFGGFIPPPPPAESAGGGGGGGAGPSVYDLPQYWSLLERQQAATTGLLGKQQEFAKQGYGLAEHEAQVRRRNMQRLFEMQQQRVMGLELPQAQRQIRNDAAARGSFMSQARILGEKEAGQAAKMGLAEAFEQNRAQVDLLNESLSQARLAMNEELTRLQAQQELADVEYQIALLRKGL